MINSIDRNPHKESRFSFQCTFASQGASYEKTGKKSRKINKQKIKVKFENITKKI
tara:strand:+ start:51 stop:215 length:165 start_codon:yes stop_codon:yes gene_type:complete